MVPNRRRRVLVIPPFTAAATASTATRKTYLNKPAGTITRAAATIGAFSTPWQITGVVVAANQNVQLTVSATSSNGGNNQDFLLALFRGSTQIFTRLYNNITTVTLIGPSVTWIDETPGAGTYTYEVRAAAFGATTLSVFQSSPTTDVAGGGSIFVAEVYTP